MYEKGDDYDNDNFFLVSPESSKMPNKCNTAKKTEYKNFVNWMFITEAT